ncbi:hypothetical protein [Streptomyces sp. NBC_01264]|uniref:hypothetical protein n=1 Tax=Streptomyces sp. NBC_01264 TaxID=2903804 RepID=UPI0022521750|nr:hypothetical protein [Streptomyces sp. NBC_01264]MCX4778172.1 hypothetical protein [Streptomyces sp. NBC_01264]
MQAINRIPPLHAVQAYQTYSIVQISDVLVRAACRQVGCTAWLSGWESTVDEGTPLGRQQAAYIRTQSGRTFRELRNAGGLTVFRFDSGQRCFAEHKTNPEAYAVRDGDWRGNPTGRVRQHQRPADWVEDMSETLATVAQDRKRG